MKHLGPVVISALILAMLVVIPARSEVVAPAQATGKITLLRVHDLGTKYGPPSDEIDVEVVIWLDSKPGRAFGFQVRNDSNGPARQGMLDLLRDALNYKWTVTIDYVGADLFDPDASKNNFVIIRAWLTNPGVVDISYQYAVKFVCGKTNGDEGVARGFYYTAINVHNPWYKKIAFKKKYAIALPLPERGRHTQFFDVGLDADQALEIDCRDVFKLTSDISRADFRKGFVVIESDVELDIVAVYTTANIEAEEIITQDIERVPSREIVKELPDLVPVPDVNGSFCRRSGRSFLVTIRNQGSVLAGPSKTELDFFNLGKLTLDTAELGPGQQTNLLFGVPSDFWDSEGNKEFRIIADVTLQVTESKEWNNVASGVCIIIE